MTDPVTAAMNPVPGNCPLCEAPMGVCTGETAHLGSQPAEPMVLVGEDLFEDVAAPGERPRIVRRALAGQYISKQVADRLGVKGVETTALAPGKVAFETKSNGGAF